MPEQQEHITPLDNSETSDLLSSTPQKIIRWGMFTLLLLLLISLLLSCLINYPDVLTANISMTSVLEPSREIAVVLSKDQQAEQEHAGSSLLLNPEEIYIGQELNIRPENYDETGMLKGIVSGMSKRYSKDSCFISLSLPDGFKTSFHKTLHFQAGMKGRADVIVKKQSLMHKLISVLKQKLNRF